MASAQVVIEINDITYKMEPSMYNELKKQSEETGVPMYELIQYQNLINNSELEE